MAFSPSDSPYKNSSPDERLVLLYKKDLELHEKDLLLTKANGQLLELAAQFKKLQRTLAIHNKKIFGSTSEKLDTLVPEAFKGDYLPFEDIKSRDEQSVVTATDTGNGQKPKRKYSTPHPGRTPLPADLERRDIHLYPEGYEAGVDTELPPLVTERLAIDIVIYVERILRHKTVREGKLLVTPFPIDDPCFRCKFSLPLVAHMLMLRFVHHLPYYRFHQLLPMGIIGYNTLIGAAGWVFDLLAPLGPVYLEEVKKGATTLKIDETTFDCLDTPGNMAAFKQLGKPEKEVSTKPIKAEKEKMPGKKKVIHTGRVWVLANEETGLVYYEFTGTRAGYVAERLLEGYRGRLVSDAYAVYISIASKPGSKIILMLCWSHGRRGFVDLVEKGNKKTDPVVLEVLRRIGELYQIEKILKGKSDAEILAGRSESAKLLVSLKAYLDKKVLLYTPKEGVAEAINYLLNHWPYFTEYTNHGKAGCIDNNFTERAVKTLTLDRKNSLFFGSVKQSQGSVLMFSLYEGCKKHNVNYVRWLTDVLQRIKTHPKDKLHELLPHNWVQKDP